MRVSIIVLQCMYKVLALLKKYLTCWDKWISIFNVRLTLCHYSTGSDATPYLAWVTWTQSNLRIQPRVENRHCSPGSTNVHYSPGSKRYFAASGRKCQCSLRSKMLNTSPGRKVAMQPTVENMWSRLRSKMHVATCGRKYHCRLSVENCRGGWMWT